MIYVPKLALESAEKIISLFICWFLSDIELASFHKNVPAITPSASTLKDIMIEEGVDTIMIELDDMKGVPLGLMCDKGEGEKKRNGASFVKLVTRFDVKKQKV